MIRKAYYLKLEGEGGYLSSWALNPGAEETGARLVALCLETLFKLKFMLLAAVIPRHILRAGWGMKGWLMLLVMDIITPPDTESTKPGMGYSIRGIPKVRLQCLHED